MSLRVSVIIPTLNEGAIITSLLQSLQPLRQHQHQIILSDGGSSDDTCLKAKSLVDHVIMGESGRAAQMNRGAKQADGDLLWFLHADTRFKQTPLELIRALPVNDLFWGRFNLQLDADEKIYRLIERLINWRSCLSRIATGDQGIFVQRKLFESLNGFANIPLMEDIELSKRLRQQHKPHCASQTIITSARRWQRQGAIRTILLMWRLRLAYFLGVSPQHLAKQYRLCNSPTHES